MPHTRPSCMLLAATEGARRTSANPSRDHCGSQVRLRPPRWDQASTPSSRLAFLQGPQAVCLSTSLRHQLRQTTSDFKKGISCNFEFTSPAPIHYRTIFPKLASGATKFQTQNSTKFDRSQFPVNSKGLFNDFFTPGNLACLGGRLSRSATGDRPPARCGSTYGATDAASDSTSSSTRCDLLRWRCSKFVVDQRQLLLLRGIDVWFAPAHRPARRFCAARPPGLFVARVQFPAISPSLSMPSIDAAASFERTFSMITLRIRKNERGCFSATATSRAPAAGQVPALEPPVEPQRTAVDIVDTLQTQFQHVRIDALLTSRLRSRA